MIVVSEKIRQVSEPRATRINFQFLREQTELDFARLRRAMGRGNKGDLLITNCYFLRDLLNEFEYNPGDPSLLQTARDYPPFGSVVDFLARTVRQGASRRSAISEARQRVTDYGNKQLRQMGRDDYM